MMKKIIPLFMLCSILLKEQQGKKKDNLIMQVQNLTSQ